MTLAQMRLALREGQRIERRRRAAFIGDVFDAARSVMSEHGADHVRDRIQDLLAE